MHASIRKEQMERNEVEGRVVRHGGKGRRHHSDGDETSQ